MAHLVVPQALQNEGVVPRAFCGWAFSSASAAIATDGNIGAREVCEKCIPRLARRLAARKAALVVLTVAAAEDDPNRGP